MPNEVDYTSTKTSGPRPIIVSTTSVRPPLTPVADKATAHAAIFKSGEELAGWMRSLVEEWKERDDKVYCVASGGRAVAKDAENPIEVRIFEVIEDQVGDPCFATLLDAGIKRFEELTGVASSGVQS
jgi:hypothetical protein